MSLRNIPASPQEITPEWLTAALQDSGLLQGTVVEAVEVAPLGERTGFSGQIARIAPRYSSPEEGAPASLIAKMPSANPTIRGLMAAQGVYRREVLFYEQAAGRTALRTPALYAGGFEPESGLSLLLLEDLAPSRAGNQEAGCGLAEARVLLRHLARCHAGWWESPELAAFSWLPGFNQGIDLETLYARSWAPFLARFQSDLPEWMVALGERFGLHVRQIRDELAASPWTLVHGDLRLDNLFFLGSAEDPEPAILDWQVASRGRGLFDVAYFLAGNLDEHRPELIWPLVEVYHRTLLDHGVTGYDLDQCLRDHRLATLFLLARTVITGGQLDLSQESARSRFLIVLRRGISAFHSFAVADLLKS